MTSKERYPITRSVSPPRPMVRRQVCLDEEDYAEIKANTDQSLAVITRRLMRRLADTYRRARGELPRGDMPNRAAEAPERKIWEGFEP